MTGKRHPYTTDYKIGLKKDGNVIAFESVMYQNAGAFADLSTAVLERSLFHATSAYQIPNCRIQGFSCRTNLPPFTAFRGFGVPQAAFVIEAALEHAASALGMESAVLRERNLMPKTGRFPHGQKITQCRVREAFSKASSKFDLAGKQTEVRAFNLNNSLQKRGVSIIPILFGISFTNTTLNQANALVHVYLDGTCTVNTGAVEMGQGVSAKILKLAAETLGIPTETVHIASTNTGRVANTSPTAASTGADLNGMATRQACLEILGRLRRVAGTELGVDPRHIQIKNGAIFRDGKRTKLSFEELVKLAYTARVSLSAQSHFATPRIYYDRQKEKGRPFAYHVAGAAITEVTLDCLRGTHKVDGVWIVHDGGREDYPLIDRGQIEGALVQGMGWLTMEEVIYADGRLTTDTLTSYKIPDIHSVPDIETVFLEPRRDSGLMLGSKAVGEPPLLYGLGTYFALLSAMKAAQPEKSVTFEAPLTPERVLLFLDSR
jgi:xanthine dehydrogenase large subunit